MGLSIKKIHDPLIFCTDRIDVITNFAVITNVVIKRVHCILSGVFDRNQKHNIYGDKIPRITAVYQIGLAALSSLIVFIKQRPF